MNDDTLSNLEKEAIYNAIDLRIGVLYAKQAQEPGRDYWFDQERLLRSAAERLGIKLCE